MNLDQPMELLRIHFRGPMHVSAPGSAMPGQPLSDNMPMDGLQTVALIILRDLLFMFWNFIDSEFILWF